MRQIVLLYCSEECFHMLCRVPSVEIAARKTLVKMLERTVVASFREIVGSHRRALGSLSFPQLSVGGYDSTWSGSFVLCRLSLAEDGSDHK